jgi:hypothetical protein
MLKNLSKVLPEEMNMISYAKRLIKVIQESTGSTRANGLRDLQQLCSKHENKEVLCLDEDLALLSSLKQLLEANRDDLNCVSWIISCINRFSLVSNPCTSVMCSKELALLPVLMSLLSSLSDESTISMIEVTIANCSMFEASHNVLLSSEIGWLDYLEKRLKEKPNDFVTYQRFVSFACSLENEKVLVLINRKIPEIVLQNVLLYGSVEKKWSQKNTEMVDQAIRFVMYVSKLINGSRYLKNHFNDTSNLVSFLHSIISSTLPSALMMKIRSLIIFANVYGRDENNERTKALLSTHRDILPLLLDITDAIVNCGTNRNEFKELLEKGFRYGFRLSVVAVALRNLSISDENKKIMINYPKLISLACQGIRLFIDDAPECKGMNPGDNYFQPSGGGGKDVITVENLLELILQLSFISENKYFSHYSICEMMKQLIALPSSRNLSFEGKQFAQQLLAKLDPPDLKREESLAVDVVVAHHIMLSYSWSANKDLVVAFGNKLKEMGYDVWRDEEGSSIFGPMSMTGNTLDAMTSAVEKSYMMIIFVSPEYKESTNCRIEGLYGFKRAASRGLKLVYVMMNQNFTTESRPMWLMVG